MHSTEIVSNSHAGENFARSMVYAGPHSSVELDGLNASIHLDSRNLSFLVRLSDDDPDMMRKELTLVRLPQKETRRVVSRYSQNLFGGQRKREYDIVPSTKVDVGDTGWVKLTPVDPLPAGEYGLIFMPKDPSLSVANVYDFDTDFAAANPAEPQEK